MLMSLTIAVESVRQATGIPERVAIEKVKATPANTDGANPRYYPVLIKRLIAEINTPPTVEKLEGVRPISQRKRERQRARC